VIIAMKRILTVKQVRRFKFMCTSTIALILLAFMSDSVFSADPAKAADYEGPYFWQGNTYNKFIRTVSNRGYVDEYTN
jgi:hypothetical protein